MTVEYLLCIAVGILIGWVTKAPFLFKLYEDQKNLHESFKKMIDRHLQSIDKTNGDNNV